jgi:hypothetical protein
MAVMPCNTVQIYRSFGRTCCLHLKMVAADSSERLACPYHTTWHHTPNDSSLCNSSCFKNVRDIKLERQQSSALRTVYKFYLIENLKCFREYDSV